MNTRALANKIVSSGIDNFPSCAWHFSQYVMSKSATIVTAMTHAPCAMLGPRWVSVARHMAKQLYMSSLRMLCGLRIVS